MVKQEKVHIIAERGEYQERGDRTIPWVETACEERATAPTRPSHTLDSDAITCPKCRKALATSFWSVSSYSSTSLLPSIVRAKIAAAVGEDRDATRLAKYLDEQFARVLSTLDSAKRDVDNERKFALQQVTHAVDARWGTALDRALAAARVGAYVVGNLNLDALDKAAVDVDKAIAVVAQRVREEDAREQMGSLLGIPPCAVPAETVRQML